MTDFIEKVTGMSNIVEDCFYNTTVRAGILLKRIDDALKGGVHENVLAYQMTINSKEKNPKNPQVFTGENMIIFQKLYNACKSGTLLTKKQKKALIKEQQASDEEDLVLAT